MGDGGSGLSRRSLLATAAAATLVGCATPDASAPAGPAPTPQPTPSPAPTPAPTPTPATPAPTTTIIASRYPAIIDTSTNVTPYLPALKALGVKTVFRYYALGLQPEVPEKQLTADEANAILDAGLSIGSVFQHYSNRPENIHAERGKQDGEASLARAAAFGQPTGSAIYFGVDFDWLVSDSAKSASIIAYFEAVGALVKPAGYRIGVYGSGQTCKLVLDAGLAELAWLVNSPGHGGAAAFYNSGRWAIFQNGLDVKIPDGRLQVDTSIVKPGLSDFGQWSRAGVNARIGEDVSALVRAGRRFVAKKSAKLYTAADAGSAVIADTRFGKGRSVRVFSITGAWAQIDVNETGKPVGYCRVDDLTADLAKRPDYFAAD